MYSGLYSIYGVLRDLINDNTHFVRPFRGRLVLPLINRALYRLGNQSIKSEVIIDVH